MSQVCDEIQTHNLIISLTHIYINLFLVLEN